MKTILIIFAALLTALSARSQENEKPSPFSVSGYLETYYAYDFGAPENNTRPNFLYSYNRHNEINLNIGFLQGSYTTERVRANLALMAGTYANANLAAEPGVLKNIYEANAGVRISARKNLWVDAGIFGSHIGFESAIGKDCWSLTRSILAENSPYYEAAAKISYTSDNGKWFLSGMILNGWQRIQRVEGNSLPSFGTQITFKPSSSVTLNSSTFIGTDKPDSARQMRYFHNFYAVVQILEKVGLTIGFDYGVEEKNSETNTMNPWLSPVVIVRFTMIDKLAVALRAEYYEDEHGVLIYTGTPHGFKTTGISANVDYAITPNAMWRLEARNFKSKDDIFLQEGEPSSSNTCITTSLAINF